MIVGQHKCYLVILSLKGRLDVVKVGQMRNQQFSASAVRKDFWRHFYFSMGEVCIFVNGDLFHLVECEAQINNHFPSLQV